MLVTGLLPKKFETFLAVRAFARLIECSLLLWRSSKVEKDDRGVAKAVSMFARASLNTSQFTLCVGNIPHLCCSAWRCWKNWSCLHVNSRSSSHGTSIWMHTGSTFSTSKLKQESYWVHQCMKLTAVGIDLTKSGPPTANKLGLELPPQKTQPIWSQNCHSLHCFKVRFRACTLAALTIIMFTARHWYSTGKKCSK